MGIYDRDYYRQAPPQFRPSFGRRSVVVTLILLNVAVWLADAFSSASYNGNMLTGRWLSDHLAAHVYTLTHPWLWWQYVTYGFTHSPLEFSHILGNMLVLFFLGRDVEERYGAGEFLRIYLATVIVAGVAWSVVNRLGGTADYVSVYGASGAIAGIVVLYALNFPHRTLLLFFVIPMPAWLLGAIVVVWDIYGAMGGGTADKNIAYSAHLAGAAFAFVYYWQQWNISRFTTFRLPRFGNPLRPKPQLKVHDPQREADDSLTQEVDRILEKISREGESSLSAKERRTLENASRTYQRKNK